MSQKVGFALLALVCTIANVSAACRRCLPLSEDEKFCHAHFAAVFKIIDDGTVIGVDRVYEVEMVALYRQTYIMFYKSHVRTDTPFKHNMVPKNSPGTEKLFTPADSRACGTTFIRDAYYVVSGYFNEKPGLLAQMTTTRCSFGQYFAKDPVPTYFPPTCDATVPEV